MKFYTHGSGKQQQLMAYNTIKDHIVHYIQKTYKNGQDIAISLRSLEELDLTLGEAINPVADKARMEQGGWT